jgi:hypothetical protein
MPWPPHGKRVDFTYLPKTTSDNLIILKAIVHYEIYDGLPLISKWVTLTNESDKEIVIDSYKSEILALTERVVIQQNWLPSLC